jgi:hypothetical protein
MAKRKSIKKQIKSKLYVAKATEGGWRNGPKPAVREAVVSEVQAVLVQPQFKKLQKHIERISITKTVKKAGRVTTGRVVDGKKKPVYKIYDHDWFTPKYYRSVAVHELAHIHWGVKQKWDNEAWTKFNTIVNELRPVNDYLERNETKWRADKRFQTANQYCNEMHSAAAELYYEAQHSGHRWQLGEDSDRLLAAYRELQLARLKLLGCV